MKKTTSSNGNLKAQLKHVQDQLIESERQRGELKEANDKFVGEFSRLQLALQKANRSSNSWERRFFNLLRLSETFLEQVPVDKYQPVAANSLSLSYNPKKKSFSSFWEPPKVESKGD